MSNKKLEGIRTYSAGKDSFADTATMPEVESTSNTHPTELHASNKGRFSRRGLFAGAAAAVVAGAAGVVVAPLVGNAKSTDPATKDDIAALEYELSMITQSSSDAELTSHKTTIIDKNSSDIQYPSAKAVYNALNDKVDMNQGTENAGYIFIVDATGKLVLNKFTSDELNATETLPVENKVIYKEIRDIRNALKELDTVPTKDSTKGVESGGVYSTYQEVTSISNFNDLTNGVNYSYTGKGIDNVEGSEYSVKKIGDAIIAISKTDSSLVYTSTNGGSSWGATYGGW